jgi:hypothetical protein
LATAAAVAASAGVPEAFGTGEVMAPVVAGAADVVGAAAVVVGATAEEVCDAPVSEGFEAPLLLQPVRPTLRARIPVIPSDPAVIARVMDIVVP